ncbi:Uncharacterised protein [Vibrio cholerae]|nr:Uncharacterised protein [Vibrio cholerae]
MSGVGLALSTTTKPDRAASREASCRSPWLSMLITMTPGICSLPVLWKWTRLMISLPLPNVSRDDERRSCTNSLK